MTSRSPLCRQLLAFALVTACSTGTPLPPPGRSPAPIREYWGPAAAQDAFDRIASKLISLEIDHATAAARSDSADPVTIRLAEAKGAARRDLSALPNPLMAEIVFSERLDIALLEQSKELALQQRLMLARLTPTDPEARRMAAVVGAIAARRDALHQRQDTLHARFLAEPSPAVGEKIRVTLPLGGGDGRARVVEGHLLELRGDSLLLTRMGGTSTAIRLPLDATLERAVSRRGHTLEGAFLGMISAGVLGGRKRSPSDDESGLRSVVYGSVGALIGGLMGSTISSETWAPVVWHRESSRTAPAGTGVGIRWTAPLGRQR
jgi:hypothetical protein